MKPLSYQVLGLDGMARLGKIETKHGTIDTPTFMPVGTAGTVKAMLPSSLIKTGSQVVLGNTYHLMLRPGSDRIKGLGGLHQFMNWPGPILTDSGGFQVMSLSKLRTLSETGVVFQSHIDGKKYNLTPEVSVNIQQKLDSTITMQLDECPAHTTDKQVIEKSMLMSLRWAERSKDSFINRQGYGLFGIVQGGTFEDFREQSIKRLVNIGFHGYAIGGLAVGEPQNTMFEVLDGLIPHIQSSWLTNGVGMAQLALQYGADDFGGTLIGEEVVSCTGARSTELTDKIIVDAIHQIGYQVEERDNFYNPIRTL